MSMNTPQGQSTVTTDENGNYTPFPQPKVIGATVGAGVGAAAGTVAVYLIESLSRIDLPDSVEGAILVLVAAGLTFAGGYFTRPSAKAS
jgi:hypothetical protein